MAFVEYIVKEGDRWDTVAFKAYGDATAFQGIINANVATVISAVLTPGSRLVIPVLEASDIEINSELLPPWKR